MVGAENKIGVPKRLSRQSWLALAYIILVYPIVWGNPGHLAPGFHALTVNGSRRGLYLFWGSVFIIEWIGFFLCLWALHCENRAAREAGLYSARFRLYLLFFAIAIVGFSSIIAAKGLNWIPSKPVDSHSLIGFTSSLERFFWLGMSVTAGICEETMFRGFAITYLREITRSTWLAVLLATVSFAYMHGGLHQGTFLFVARFAIGLILAGIYLWRGTLLPGMFLHFLIDASAIL